MSSAECFWINPFLPDVCAMKVKKSPIFSLSLHTHQVKTDNEGSKLKSVFKASKNRRFFDALNTDFNFEPSLSH